MKVAVIGNGNVGKATFRELQALYKIHELVIVGRDVEACQAEAEDYKDAIPLRLDSVGNVDGGGFELCEGADILVYCAGPSLEQGSTDRMEILNQNILVMKEVFAQVDQYAPDAIVVVVSNPLDVMTAAITEFTGRPSHRVIGTGTLLDSARMLKILSWMINVSVCNLGGYVLGEHGSSSVPILSSTNVMGMHLEDYIEVGANGTVSVDGEEITDDVQDAGFKIFRGKGYTSAGVAAAVARIVNDIIDDNQEIIPVSTVLHGEYGVDGFAMSVPCQIGAEGVVAIRKLLMTDEEREALDKSAAAIKENYDLVKGILCGNK